MRTNSAFFCVQGETGLYANLCDFCFSEINLFISFAEAKCVTGARKGKIGDS